MYLTVREKRGLLATAGKQRYTVWRFKEPVNAELNKVYEADGHMYTIRTCSLLTQSDVRRHEKRDIWQRLMEQWPDGVERVRRYSIMLGDWTDEPIYLQPTGRGSGDYTRRYDRAMPREPEPVRSVLR